MLLALLTQWVRCDVPVADALPGTAIAAANGRVSVVLFVAPGLLLFVFLTEPTMR